MLVLFCLAFGKTPVRGEDWPQFGGNYSRNMASDEKGIPEWFEPGKKEIGRLRHRHGDHQNVQVGRAAGAPKTTPARRLPPARSLSARTTSISTIPTISPTGGGVLLCLDEATGKLLWRLVVPKTEHSQHSSDYDSMELGICSTPTVDGDRVYVVTNRDEVLCLDIEGMANGNDGPFTDERHYTGELIDPQIGHVPGRCRHHLAVRHALPNYRSFRTTPPVARCWFTATWFT